MGLLGPRNRQRYIYIYTSSIKCSGHEEHRWNDRAQDNACTHKAAMEKRFLRQSWGRLARLYVISAQTQAKPSATCRCGGHVHIRKRLCRHAARRAKPNVCPRKYTSKVTCFSSLDYPSQPYTLRHDGDGVGPGACAADALCSAGSCFIAIALVRRLVWHVGRISDACHQFAATQQAP